MVTVTFVRHGESEDNLKAIWAGWKDAPLSPLGRQQAALLGKAFSSVKIDHIYASPLLRAAQTAQAIHDDLPNPKPPFETNWKLKEQHFGIAEGHKWALEAPPHSSWEELFRQGIFPVQHGLDEKFPEGESVNDLAKRADEAIQETVFHHLDHVAGEEQHIVLTSHGHCIAELIAALFRLDPEGNKHPSFTYRGLHNTAWTRVNVSRRDDGTLKVVLGEVNNKDHLKELDVESTRVDDTNEEQAAARAFFSGATGPVAEAN
ncbi:hypothetical protein AX16_005023 [Volvariella volvacea WC 439]|nr:hypothetical protein AX16_005023 [Volvariella volvacea WC 439]